MRCTQLWKLLQWRFREMHRLRGRFWAYWRGDMQRYDSLFICLIVFRYVIHIRYSTKQPQLSFRRWPSCDWMLVLCDLHAICNYVSLNESNVFVSMFVSCSCIRLPPVYVAWSVYTCLRGDHVITIQFSAIKTQSVFSQILTKCIL